MLQHMASGEEKDSFISDFSFIGGTPGPRAFIFTVVWIIALVALAFSILLCFIAMQFLLAIVLVFVIAAVGSLPTLFLIGSRI